MSETQSIQINDTPLVSMVLVDDNNNRTTFNGPIINDFTITEDLQSKINQLTTLATNIGNLQTRLTNITNILNTQNIEFTNEDLTDTSSAGSKLYILPEVYILLGSFKDNKYISRYLNLTPYVSGKYNFSVATPLNVTCSLGIDYDYIAGDWDALVLSPSRDLTENKLTVQIAGEVNDITNISLNNSSIFNGDAWTNTPQEINGNVLTIDLNTTSNGSGHINITLTK